MLNRGCLLWWCSAEGRGSGVCLFGLGVERVEEGRGVFVVFRQLDERLHGVQAAVDAGDLPQRAQQPLTQTAPARGAARGVQESQQPTHVISVVTLPESRKGSLHNVLLKFLFFTKCRAKFNS